MIISPRSPPTFSFSLNLNPIPMNYINHTIRGTRRRSHRHSLFILSIFLLFLFLRPVTGDADNNGKKESKKEDMREASLVERAIGITGLNSRWDTIRTWAKLAWMNIRPPDSKYGQGSDSSNVVKEAAVRSFETSKEAVQQSAASAAMAAGEAVEKTTEKLRRTLSTERDAKTDL